jgi:hypothetical protein
LGHYEEEKKKISHRIAFDTIFIKKKPEKKGKKSLKSQLSKSFHVGMG